MIKKTQQSKLPARRDIICFIIIVLAIITMPALQVFAIDQIGTSEMILPPSAENAALAVGSSKDSIAPSYIFPFIFTGTHPLYDQSFDVSTCTNNCLYIYNKNNNTLTQIGETSVSDFTTTKDNLFYVTTGQEILQTDYNNASHTSIYQAEHGEISSLEFFDDKLYFIENETRLVMIDLSSRTASTFFVHPNLNSFFVFDGDKIIWENQEGETFYYNATSKESIHLANDHEVNIVTAPYITPTISEEDAAIMAQTSLNYNDVQFPASPYYAGFYTVVDHYDYRTPISYFKESNYSTPSCDHVAGLYNCMEYAKSNQCDGFARWAYEKYVHQLNYKSHSPLFEGNGERIRYYEYEGTDDETDEYNHVVNPCAYKWNETKFREKIQPLSTGAFLRFGKINDSDKCVEQHSAVVVYTDEYGVALYECNNDKKCGVFYSYYTYAKLASKYHCVRYSASHNFSSTPINVEEAEEKGVEGVHAGTKHVRMCNTCSGYLVSSHDSSTLRYFQYNETQHKVTYLCCDHKWFSDHVFEGTYPECVLCGEDNPDVRSLNIEIDPDMEE